MDIQTDRQVKKTPHFCPPPRQCPSKVQAPKTRHGDEVLKHILAPQKRFGIRRTVLLLRGTENLEATGPPQI